MIRRQEAGGRRQEARQEVEGGRRYVSPVQLGARSVP